MAQFRGVFSVLSTPFKSSGEIDVPSLHRLVDTILAAGVIGVTALGVTSEVSRLNEAERKCVMETVLDRIDGRVPVVVGASADGQMVCLEFCRMAAASGAAAVMVSPPRMVKISSDAVFRHFATLASDVNIPIIVQDYPPASGYAMEAALLARIARDIPAARTIKLEDPPTPLKVARILSQTQGIPVQILGGLGGVFLLEELLAGATGVMTGFAYPEILVRVVNLFTTGDVDAAANVFYRYVPLMRFEFQDGIGLAIRKEILRRRGAIDEATVRAPGDKLDPHTLSALDLLLKWIEANGESLWS
jgi:4-hydroxy-tetrahydrodipicolinate synthase